MHRLPRATPADRRHLDRGFTLIELMIAVVIVGLLTMLAYPAYTQSVRKSRRADAKTALLDLASREERFMAANNRFSNTPSELALSGTAFPVAILSGSTNYYNLSVTLSNANASFAATATPTANQAADPCGTFTLNELGAQGNTGNTAASADCW